MVLICINLSPPHPRMLWVQFGWNWPGGSWEEDENVKSLQTDRQTDRQTDGRQAFSSGDLKSRKHDVTTTMAR